MYINWNAYRQDKIWLLFFNQMQNNKIETNSELIYEDGGIWSTLIFIKIIGNDTLWFPLPPSEVLSHISS